MFSNGCAYMDFNEAFCCRCKKYKLNDDGLPAEGNCKIEERICMAQFDETQFPYEHLIKSGRFSEYICKEFETDDKKLQDSFKKLLDEYEEE